MRRISFTSTASGTIWRSWQEEGPLTEPVCWQAEKRGRDRADKPEYKVKLSVACCFSNKHPVVEHYHNSSFLEHGGSRQGHPPGLRLRSR